MPLSGPIEKSTDLMSSAYQTIKRRGLMFILSSPSGAGKTTITRALLQRNKDLAVSLSVTTRPRRPGEVSGQDYKFLSVNEFTQMRDNGLLLEHAKVHDNWYGTPREPVEEALKKGQDIVFDIDWQGTQQLAEISREDLVTIFILPPSVAELERRLRTRARDPETVIRKRLAKSADEMSHYSEYDYVIVNHDVETSIAQAQTILEAERLKRHRQSGLAEFIRGLKQGL